MHKFINQHNDEVFNVWAWSCSHLNADIDAASENNIETALQQLDDDSLDYDFSVCTGDFDSNQNPPTLIEPFKSDGETLVSAFDYKTGFRDKLYPISGNHDCGDANMDWFARYIDIKRENTAYSNADPNNFPYTPVYMNGTDWHSYYFVKGKHLFLMISDRNELPYPYGRGGSAVTGGHPSGTITKETWDWMQSVILTNTDKNIYVMTHQNPRFTTIGTGDGDGSIGIDTIENLHGESGIASLSGALGSIYDEYLLTADSPTTAILDFLRDNDHTVITWMAGHSHSYLDETLNNKTERYDIHGVSFINIGHLTRYHIGSGRTPTHSMSKYLTISNHNLKIQHFNHEAIDGNPIGFYNPLEYNIKLKV